MSTFDLYSSIEGEASSGVTNIFPKSTPEALDIPGCGIGRLLRKTSISAVVTSCSHRGTLIAAWSWDRATLFTGVSQLLRYLTALTIYLGTVHMVKDERVTTMPSQNYSRHVLCAHHNTMHA